MLRGPERQQSWRERNCTDIGNKEEASKRKKVMRIVEL